MRSFKTCLSVLYMRNSIWDFWICLPDSEWVWPPFHFERYKNISFGSLLVQVLPTLVWVFSTFALKFLRILYISGMLALFLWCKLWLFSPTLSIVFGFYDVFCNGTFFFFLNKGQIYQPLFLLPLDFVS